MRTGAEHSGSLSRARPLTPLSGRSAGARVRSRRHRGITFTEVMFAVILLGIGFIMLAGLFAVAGQQTIQTTEESSGASYAYGAGEYLRQFGDDTAWVPTGGAYVPLPAAIWARVRGDLVSPMDSRFAWTAAYCRNSGEQFAHVIVFALQSRVKGQFDASDVVRNGFQPATLDPKPVSVVQMLNIDPGVDRVVLNVADPAATPAASGAFLVIAQGNFAGRIYRLGNQVNSNTWELQPGYDLKSPAENIGSPVPALLVGKANTAASNQTANYAGYAMDIAAYPTTIRLGY